MENSKNPAFSSWEVEDALQRNSVSSSFFEGVMAAKKKVFVTWFNINNIQMKVKLLWVGKETTWYLNYKPFPTRTESLWLNNAEKE